LRQEYGGVSLLSQDLVPEVIGLSLSECFWMLSQVLSLEILSYCAMVMCAVVTVRECGFGGFSKWKSGCDERCGNFLHKTTENGGQQQWKCFWSMA